MGIGATGSHLAYQLIKLGIQELSLWDDDSVEAHNVANQFFFQQQIGELKTEALRKLLWDINPSCKININSKLLTNKSKKLSGIVFLLVDDMQSRKEIWEHHIKFNNTVPFMIEARMGTHHGQIFTINPMDLKEIKLWESFWYPNEAVKETTTACGGSQTMCPTASIIAGHMAWQFINVINKDDYQRNLTLGISPPMVA